MKSSIYKISLLLCVAWFVSCATPNADKPEFPAEVRGVGDTPNQPLLAAGFQRGKIVTHEPGMLHVSTDYHLNSRTSHIVSTLSTFPTVTTLDSVFEKKIEETVAANKRLEIVEFREVVLTMNGVEYRALQASLNMIGEINGKQQALFSLLTLWQIDDGVVELQSSSPIAESEFTIVKHAALITAVDWSYQTPS